MHFKIHRGTQEIGGSCVEVWTDSTRILLDFGMPLVEKDGKEFDFNKYKQLNTEELIKEGVLPDVKGLYTNNSDKLIDAVIISHAHQDHYGLLSFIHNDVRCFLSKPTHQIIELSNIFTPQSLQIATPAYFEKNMTFTVGDIKITPFWTDHSAFDAHSFLVESGGKSLFYSGDFRSHGRKANAFRWFLHNAPKHVDYLLLEGTTVGRSEQTQKSEKDIEYELTDIFNSTDKINLIYTSGQNIDRLVSIYRACIRSNKTFVADVYIAKVLKTLSVYASIPFPSLKKFPLFKVIFSYHTCNQLSNKGLENVLYEFKDFKITKEEISSNARDIVMLVRPSMQKDLEHISGIEDGNFIYSLWQRYLNNAKTQKFILYLKSRGFVMHNIHTSGHANIKTILRAVEALKPKNIVPIHTFEGNEYKNIFKENVVQLKDGVAVRII